MGNDKNAYNEESKRIREIIEDALDIIKKGDVTFEFTTIMTSNECYISYCYRGKLGIMLITFAECITISDKMFGTESNIKDINQLPGILKSMFYNLKDENKMTELLNPPYMHFRKHLYYKFKREEELIKETFFLLTEEAAPREVEVVFATEPDNAYKVIENKKNSMIIQLMNLYFVVNFSEKEVEKHHELKEAFQMYNNQE